MGKEKKGIIERLSWKSIVAAIITFLGVYFGIPEYTFNIRPSFVAYLGSDVVSFIEGAISGTITVVLVLKLYSQLSSKTKEGKVKPEYVSKAVPFEDNISPNKEKTLFEVEGKGSFQRLEIQARGNPDSKMILEIDDNVLWRKSFAELYQEASRYLRKYVLLDPARRDGTFAIELDLPTDFFKNSGFSVKNHDANSDLEIKGTAYFNICETR